MNDDARKVLLGIVAQIPPTWTCLECGAAHDNSPHGVQPWARKTGYDEKGQQVVIGEICRNCFEK